MTRHTFFTPNAKLPSGILFGQQTHSTNIAHVETGNEDLSETDGLITTNQELILGVKTADCAPIAFIGKERFGIVHAGWRGLVDGIIEAMLAEFSETPQIWIGPLYPEFEIQQDECYERIFAKFGKRFLRKEEGKLEFLFLEAISSIIPSAEFCGISTFDNPEYASWRRDGKIDKQNITVVGRFSDS